MTSVVPNAGQHVPGHVYLLHFDRKVGHAQHYLGWAIKGKLFHRLAQHEAGNGKSSPLIRALMEAGGSFCLARTWEGDRFLERRLKRQRNVPRNHCPICRKEARDARAAEAPDGAVVDQPTA